MRKRCDHCGKLKEGVYKTIDPFIAEIHPESDNPETYWCEECHKIACDEI